MDQLLTEVVLVAWALVPFGPLAVFLLTHRQEEPLDDVRLRAYANIEAHPNELNGLLFPR